MRAERIVIRRNDLGRLVLLLLVSLRACQAITMPFTDGGFNWPLPRLNLPSRDETLVRLSPDQKPLGLCTIQQHMVKKDELMAKLSEIGEKARVPLINAFSGAVAALAAYLVATPVEAIKVGLQTWPGTNVAGVVKRIVGQRGPAGFLYGLDAMYSAGVPYSIVMYSSYQPIRGAVNDVAGESVWGSIIGAGVAEVIGLLFFIPGELVRMRMMNDPGKYSSMLTAFPALVAERGPAGMFKGFKATAFRDVPYTAIQFVVFEQLRTLLAERKGDASAVTLLDSVFVGVQAALIASALTIPLDVIKSRLMTSSSLSGMRATTRTLIREGGTRSFVKGFFPYTGINAAKWSVSMAVYSTVREALGAPPNTAGGH